MKKIVISAVASLVLGLAVQPVQAADLEMPGNVSADAWTGFYVGGGVSVSSPDIKNLPDISSAQAGICDDDTCRTSVRSSGENADAGFAASAAANCFDESGTCSSVALAFVDDSFDLDVTGHVMAGYMRQFGIFILGIDGDYMFGGDINGYPDGVVPANPTNLAVPSDLNGGFCDAVDADACAVAGVDVAFQPKGHVRGLLGLELDENIMMFVAGGVAFADASIATTAVASNGPVNEAGGSDTDRGSLVGYSIGGGAQARVTSNVHLRIEMLYDDFGSLAFSRQRAANAQTSINGTQSVAAADAESRGKISFTNTILRGSVIWQF